jgi:hypothetical protein
MTASMTCQFLSPDSPRWNEYLADTIHDFYHLPRYVELCARQDGGRPLALLAEEDGNGLFVPLVVRPFDVPERPEDRCLDATSPYGYPCPILKTAGQREADGGFFGRAIAALRSALAELGVVSAFFRLHPLVPLPQEPLRQHGCVVRHGQTVVIDLTLSEEQQWRQVRADHRSGINRSKAGGYLVTIDPQWNDLDDFLRVYTETMRRVGAKDCYFFSRDYFSELRRCQPGAFHLCTVRIGGDVACAGIFSERCGIVQFHLSGTSEQHLKRYPSKIMLDHVRRWAKERGNRLFHLGGGLGAGEDSLFLFKAGFSHLRADFHTWRVVIQEEAYQRRLRWWETSTGTTADPPDGYFPAYRKPFDIIVQGNLRKVA